MSPLNPLLMSVRHRNRTLGIRIRFDHPEDCRAFLFRCSEFLAGLQTDDASRLSEVMLSMAENEVPPDFETQLGVPSQWPGKAMFRRKSSPARAASIRDRSWMENFDSRIKVEIFSMRACPASMVSSAMRGCRPR